MTKFENQRIYLSDLNQMIDSPVYTAQNFREGKSYRPGYQKPLGKMLPVDHRSIGSNEVILELDASSFSQNSKYAKIIIEYLDSQLIPYYPFWSGNKSIHIHIFLSNPDIKSKEVIDVLLEAHSLGMSFWKEIRLKVAREIIVQSGLNEDLIGHGKIVDLAKLSFDDVGSKGSLIRCCGGANKKKDNMGNFQVAYKTYLTKIPSSKPKKSTPWVFEDVEFPDLSDPAKRKRYTIDETYIVQIAQDYIGKLTNTARKELLNINYEGKYISLPCVRTLLEGAKIGSRSYSAQQIAIACKLDGLSKDQTKKLITGYVNECPQVPTPFTVQEGHKWVDWIFKLNKPYFACGLSRNLDVCDKLDCEYHKEKYKKDLEVFTKNDPLEKIKEVLDMLIVGEDKVKLQFFLILLTRFFDCEWFALLDGPASSGKSHLMKKVVSITGEEGVDYFIYSRITGAVLNRLEEEAEKWHNNVVIIEEFQGVKASLEQFRILISEGKLSLLETIEENVGGVTERKAGNKTVKLKNTIFATCQAESEDEGDQMKTRAWILNTDQSEEQTKGITNYYFDEFGGIKKSVDETIDEVKHALKALVVPDIVIFPFIEDLKEFLPFGNVRARRDVKKFIALIKAIAYLNQSKRYRYTDKNHKDVLLADWRDVKIAYTICWDTIIATLQGLGQRDMHYYGMIGSHLTHVPEFSVQDVMRWCKIDRNSAYKLMSRFINEGFFENIKKAPDPAIYKTTGICPVTSKLNPTFAGKDTTQVKLLSDWVKKHKLNPASKKERK